MPSRPTTFGDPARLRGQVRPPDLRDSSRFVRLRRVPVVTLNVRKFRKGDKVVTETIDEEKLHRIAHNSNERANRGEYGLLLAGHTTDDGPETKQPPVVGYTSRYQVGEHNGKPAVLADMYILKNKNPERILEQYPRRSPEIMGLDDPDAYVDAVAMIRRSPELDLGYVSHYRIDRDMTRQLGTVSRYKSGRQIYRFHCSKYCPTGEPSRFASPSPPSGELDGPSEEFEHESSGEFEPSEERPMPVMNHNTNAVAKLLEAVKHLVLGEAEEPESFNEPSIDMDHEEPSDGEDFLGDVSGEPSEGGFSPSEPSMDLEEEEGGSPSEPSGEFEEEVSGSPSEPSKHRSHHHMYQSSRKPSRHRKPSRNRHHRYQASPSEPSEPSASPSASPERMREHRHSSRHQSTMLPMQPPTTMRHGGGHGGGKHGASRMDPQFVDRRPPKPKKFQAGGGGGGQSGYPGDYDSYTPKPGGSRSGRSGVSRHSQSATGADSVMSGGRGGGRRVKVEGTSPRTSMRKEGEVSRHSQQTTERRPSRMQRDSERTKVSRYQRENEELRSRIARLEDQDKKSRFQAHVAQIERQVIQLESEGVVLDRAEEVERLSRFASSKDVSREIKRMRSRYTRTAVGQPMIPASLFEDPNEAAQQGAGLSRYGHISEQERVQMDTDGQGCEIVGSGQFKFANQNRDKVNGNTPVELARNSVARFFESRQPTRGRKSRNDDE